MRGFPDIMARLLHNRGINEPIQAEAFLAADKRLHDSPFLLPDMERALARVHRALSDGENIAIYGDFDADGVCGTAILVEGLRSLGGKVTHYIPNRLEDNRGISPTTLDSLHREGATLLITVDCGTTAISEVMHAKRMGLDVIITDHHSAPHSIPPNIVVVNPCRKDSAYPFPSLAGAGVAYKLLEALSQALGNEDHLEDLLDLVAVATVADVMPLIGENRYLTTKGLRVLNNTKRPGLQEMVHIAGLDMGKLGVEDIAWSIAPRLNSAGRVDMANRSYNLLMTNSRSEAARVAQELEQTNSERQRLTEEMTAKAREQLSILARQQPLLMVGDEEYHPGVIGLVAGRLTEQFYRPAIVLKLGRDTSQGSARSVAEFNIVAALEECSDLLLRFGGHPRAAGFTIPTADIPELERRLLQIAERQLSGIDLRPTLRIESQLSLSSINTGTFKTVNELAPFGEGNPVPTFLSCNVDVVDCRAAGTNQNHLKLKLTQGDSMWSGIGFRLGEHLSEVSRSIDIVYNLLVNRWHGEDLLELNILDFTPAA